MHTKYHYFAEIKVINADSLVQTVKKAGWSEFSIFICSRRAGLPMMHFKLFDVGRLFANSVSLNLTSETVCSNYTHFQNELQEIQRYPYAK